jgi:hypothetical protein
MKEGRNEEEEAAAGLAHTRNSVVWAVALDPNNNNNIM